MICSDLWATRSRNHSRLRATDPYPASVVSGFPAFYHLSMVGLTTCHSGWWRLRGRQIGQKRCNAYHKRTNRFPIENCCSPDHSRFNGLHHMNALAARTRVRIKGHRIEMGDKTERGGMSALGQQAVLMLVTKVDGS